MIKLGTVRDVHDPMRAGRVRLEVRSVYGNHVSPWAVAVLPPKGVAGYKEGDLVAVDFLSDDVRYPVVLGHVLPYNGAHNMSEFSAFTLATYQDESRDALDHATDEWDNADHRKGEGHTHPPYWNPYVFGWFGSLGSKFFASEEPGNQRTEWRDRIGQFVCMVGDVLAPKDPHDETRIGGEYAVADLDADSEVAKSGWRSKLEVMATHFQQLVFRVADEDQKEEVLLDNRNFAGDHGASLLMSNSKLSKLLRLTRFIPGRTQSYEQLEDPLDPTADHQRMFDWHGLEVKINSDSVTPLKVISLKTPSGELVELRENKAGLFGIYAKDRLGNELHLDALLDIVTLKHHLGQMVEMDASGASTVQNDAGNEKMVLNPAGGGIDISSAGGVSINGKAVAVAGDGLLGVDSSGDTLTAVTVDGKGGL